MTKRYSQKQQSKPKKASSKKTPAKRTTATRSTSLYSTKLVNLPPDLFAMEIIPRLDLKDLFNLSSTCRSIASTCEIEFHRLHDRIEECPHPLSALKTYRSTFAEYLNAHNDNEDFCQKCITCYAEKDPDIIECEVCENRVCHDCDNFGVCRSCDLKLCSSCYNYPPCAKCGEWICEECDEDGNRPTYCSLCKRHLCTSCTELGVWKCDECGYTSCTDTCWHVWVCHFCYKKSCCVNCFDVLICSTCHKSACSSCSEARGYADGVRMCGKCGDMSCHVCKRSHECEMCGETICSDCCEGFEGVPFCRDGCEFLPF